MTLNGISASNMEMYPPWGILHNEESMKVKSMQVIRAENVALMYCLRKKNISVIIMPVTVIVPVTAKP